MDLLTFGKVILFKNNHYVWLAIDQEEGKLHLAIILDKENTKELIMLDDVLAKRPSHSPDTPPFAYVVLTTDNFAGCAANLMNSAEHAENKDDFSVLGELNSEDVTKLKKCILKGFGLPARLVNLVKDLE